MIEIEKLQRLLTHLESTPEEEFCYEEFFPDILEECNYQNTISKIEEYQEIGFPPHTRACIAGHAVMLFPDIDLEAPIYGYTHMDVPIATYLGLSDDDRKYLFFDWGNHTKAAAIHKLKYLIKNGTLSGHVLPDDLKEESCT